MQMRRLTWVRSRQKGVFHYIKANPLYENRFIPPRWNLTSAQVRSYLGGIIFPRVNSFCWGVPPRQDYSYSLDSVCFYNYYVKKCNSSSKIWNKNKKISKQWKQLNFLKIVKQVNWDEKYLTQAGYFSHVNAEWKVSH